MSKYPDVITDEILKSNAHLSDAEILQDIRDTAAEILTEEDKHKAYSLLANHDRMASFRADAARHGARERKDFVEFLEKLLQARQAKT